MSSATFFVKPDFVLSKKTNVNEYDWKSGFVNEFNFPHNIITIGRWEYRIIYPNKVISSDKAKLLCEEDDWQSSQIEHLIVFAEKFPKRKRKFPIVALGSICILDGGCHYAPGLWYDGDRQGITLDFISIIWGSDYRFLSVRKISN